MIFIDTWLWMELLGNSAETEEAQDIIQSTEKKVISTAVLTELRYHCTKKFNVENTESITHLIESNDNILIVHLTNEIAKLAADLRLKYYDKKTKDLSFIDVINLATAILTGCNKFYTGDKDFDDINEIKVENIRKPKINEEIEKKTITYKEKNKNSKFITHD